MARFRYVAKDMGGKVHRGTTEAASEKALVTDLTSQGLFLVQAKNLTEEAGHRKLKPKQLSEFCKELSTLLSSGISMVRALDIISEQEGISSTEREIYQEVLGQLVILLILQCQPVCHLIQITTSLTGSQHTQHQLRKTMPCLHGL